MTIYSWFDKGIGNNSVANKESFNEIKINNTNNMMWPIAKVRQAIIQPPVVDSNENTTTVNLPAIIIFDK